jgi:hypothetical protein
MVTRLSLVSRNELPPPIRTSIFGTSANCQMDRTTVVRSTLGSLFDGTESDINLQPSAVLRATAAELTSPCMRLPASSKAPLKTRLTDDARRRRKEAPKWRSGLKLGG